MDLLYILGGLLTFFIIINPYKTFYTITNSIIIIFYVLLYIKNSIIIKINKWWNSSYKKVNNKIISILFYNENNKDTEILPLMHFPRFININLRDIVYEVCNSKQFDNVYTKNFNINTRIEVSYKTNDDIKKIVYHLTKKDIDIEQKRIKSDIIFNTFQNDIEKMQNVFGASVSYLDNSDTISINNEINSFYQYYYTYDEKIKGVNSYWLNIPNYKEIEDIVILTEDLIRVSYTINNENSLIKF